VLYRLIRFLTKIQAFGLPRRVHGDDDVFASELLLHSVIGSALAFDIQLLSPVNASALLFVPNNPQEYFEGFEGSFGWPFYITISASSSISFSPSTVAFVVELPSTVTFVVELAGLACFSLLSQGG